MHTGCFSDSPNGASGTSGRDESQRVLDEHEKLFAGQIEELMNLLNERNKPVG